MFKEPKIIRTTYTVVENAGYEGERDVKTFKNMFAAYRWVEKTYVDGEAEDLHVGVRRCKNGVREYV